MLPHWGGVRRKNAQARDTIGLLAHNIIIQIYQNFLASLPILRGRTMGYSAGGGRGGYTGAWRLVSWRRARWLTSAHFLSLSTQAVAGVVLSPGRPRGWVGCWKNQEVG